MVQSSIPQKISSHWEYKCDQGEGLEFLHKAGGTPYLATICPFQLQNLSPTCPLFSISMASALVLATNTSLFRQL